MPPAPEAPDPALAAAAARGRAWHLVRIEGRSLRDVGAELGVTGTTISRWVAAIDAERNAAAQGGARTQEAPATADGDDLELEDADESADAAVDDVLGLVRRMLADTKRRITQAETAGNLKVAQAAGADATKQAILLARIERMQKADGSALRITKEEIAQAFESVEQKALAVIARPVLCSECGRRLSAEIAGRSRK